MYTRYAEPHKRENNAGPGDHRATAKKVVEDQDIVGKWTDKVVLVTGTSSGIGIETAAAMKLTGAKVYMTVRNVEKGKAALKDILEPGKAELLELDLNSLASVRACAAAFQAKESKLNILINNAGVMAVPHHTVTQDGFETQFGVNHLAHFLLFRLLKPQLLAGSSPEFNSRVVNLSSVGHRSSPTILDDLNLESKYEQWMAYGHAKTAVIWSANEIERRYGNKEAVASGKAIHAFSVMPGGIKTGLQTFVPEFDVMWEIPEVAKAMKTPAQGAATSVWAAVEKEFEGTGAMYLEDCMVGEPAKEGAQLGDTGYASWAFDAESAKKLWEESCELVGVRDA
ncbi:Short-chain dehydrogenase TIC 32, chloroplastic [Cyphellophora attinorum]|uniref:Short-chain dehydrogenase TIC 32, chloroplastic n=1 Tax=Cyphellophora attinorum TaxID=1664694 RepID=A0A0N1HK06_9EURO|nr:Short-chain dehydrogenase TIC 32, chloroplastic [Phialophora attinorum]KPI36985.1 Short-chain dehydrogenase TIC 32, chloroplastic [Phialophora attinorum]